MSEGLISKTHHVPTFITRLQGEPLTVTGHNSFQLQTSDVTEEGEAIRHYLSEAPPAAVTAGITIRFTSGLREVLHTSWSI